MKMIFLSRLCHQTGNQVYSLSSLGLLAIVSVLLGGSFWFGYTTGEQNPQPQMAQSDKSDLLREALQEQQRLLAETRQTAQANVDALALRLGEMQSQVLRLDALGERLTEMGKLDSDEFNFSETPARGGVDAGDEALPSTDLNDLVTEMSHLEQTLQDREQKLNLLADLMNREEIEGTLAPKGRPIKGGWISSYYGKRKDPFTGKNAFHHGVDLAGKKGSDVFAVASGVVTEAGPKHGFGYLVEILHAGGYVTRYAHNSKIFVKLGDLVKRGDRIGLMGSTGRSTGPHVHFEIVRNGKSINPLRYLKKKS